MSRALLAWISFVAALLAAAPAGAYVRTRSPDGKFEPLWSVARVTMTLRTAGAQIVSSDDFKTAALRAAATWSAPGLGSSVLFTIDNSLDAPPGTRYDHVNTISFRSDSWTAPMYPDSALALTTVWSQQAHIVDADTELNAVDPRFQWGLLPDDPALAAMASEVDLQNALTHELGHVLGLAHPCFLGQAPSPPELDQHGGAVLACSDPTLPAAVEMATMFPSSQPGSIGERALSPDEIAALHDLYPASAAPAITAPDLGSRSGGCRVGPASDGAGGPVAMVLAAAVALARLRRSRDRRPPH
jgi:hypothetical protein